MALEELIPQTLDGLIYEFLLPFVIVFAIFWGILSGLRVFARRINLVLSLALTAVAWYGGVFVWLSGYILQLGAYVGVAAFVLVFIVGIAMWVLGRGKEMYYGSMAPEEKVRKISEKIEKLYDKLDKTSDESKRRAIIDSIRRLEMEREVAARARKW